MNEMSWKEAIKSVQNSMLAEVYEKRKSGWFRYSHGIGQNVSVDEVDKWQVPKEVKSLRRVTGCNIIFTNGLFSHRPVTKGCPHHRERVVVDPRYSDAAAVGAAVGGLLRGLFK